MAATTVNGAKKNNGFFSNMANPVIRKMEKKAEYGDSTVASYGGIAGKTIFFLIITIIGVLGYMAIHNILIASTTDVIQVTPTDDNKIFDFAVTMEDMLIVAVSAIISLITPFLAWLIRPTIPVTGTLYALAQGVIVGFITISLRADLKWIALLAAVLTIVLVGVMLFIYAKRIIKVNARFKGIIIALFATIVISGLLFFIFNLIPATRNFMTGINQIMSSPVISIISSIAFIIIAALFMLADFDTIERCVANRMDKKYEWMAAWGLAYTILYVYFKILRLLLIIFGNSKGGSSKSGTSF